MADPSDLSHKRKRESHHNGSEEGIIKAAKIPKISQLPEFVRIQFYRGIPSSTVFLCHLDASKTNLLSVDYLSEITRIDYDRYINQTTTKTHQSKVKKLIRSDMIQMDNTMISPDAWIESGLLKEEDMKYIYGQIYLSLWLHGRVDILFKNLIEPTATEYVSTKFAASLCSYWRSQNTFVPKLVLETTLKMCCIFTNCKEFGVLDLTTEELDVPHPHKAIAVIYLV